MAISAFGSASCRGIFGSLILAAFAAVPATAETILIQQGTAMRYLDNRVDPGIGLTWIDPDYDDGAPWKDGTYAVGYSAGGMIRTQVPAGTLSVYTRATFQLADPAAIENIFRRRLR